MGFRLEKLPAVEHHMGLEPLVVELLLVEDVQLPESPYAVVHLPEVVPVVLSLIQRRVNLSLIHI